MLYETHIAQKDRLKLYFGMTASTLRMQAGLMRAFNAASFARPYDASAEIAERIVKDYPKQPFGLDSTTVREEIICDRPFGSLLHFKRDTTRNDPKILLVAPMSGHYATLLRDMVKDLLPHHDVYITDWKNARDVPLRDGNFSLEDYVTYVKDFIEAIGPDTHVVGISQSTVPLLAATALLAADRSKAQPASMTLMCGPVDTRLSPTAINAYAKKNPLSWFKDNVIARVPSQFSGEGRLVYPGFMQLAGLKASDPGRHAQAQIDLFRHICNGNDKEAEKIRAYYDEYDAVMDSADQFYLDTIYHVFQNHTLAKGEMTWRGQKVNPAAIRKTALLTVEGQKDTICGNGQTLAAHALCGNLKNSQRYAYSQPDAGHYDILNPARIAGFIRTVAEQNGISYDTMPETAMIRPQRQSLETARTTLTLLRDGANDNTKTRPVFPRRPAIA